MASTPKRNPVQTRRMVELLIYISRDAYDAPTEADLQPHVLCRRIFHGVGDKLPYAELIVNQAALGIRIGNEFVSERMNKKVEIWTRKQQVDRDEADSIRDQPLFAGEISSGPMSMTLDSEERVLIARVAPYHFGTVSEGQNVWDYDGLGEGIGKHVHNNLPLEFNPMIENKIYPNRAPVKVDGELNPHNLKSYSIWADPESTRDEDAAKEYHSKPESWDLKTILETLFGELNSDETDIKNPTEEDLATLADDDMIPEVQNVTLKIGQHLNDYLSDLLPQFGYQWFLDFQRVVTDGQPTCESKIVLFKRSKGSVKKQLLMPAWGDDYTLETANTESLSVEFDVADVTNKVIVYGSHEQYEKTFNLYRSWKPSEDSQIAESKPNNHIGRKWCANEDGSLKGLRPEIPEDPPLTEWVPRKRELEDCLALRADDKGLGHRRFPYLEISTDGGKTWRDARDLDDDPESGGDFGGWTLLPKEIGIWITAGSKGPPEILQETDPDKLKLRITGTVTSDVRLRSATSKADQSPNARECVQVIDASDRFHYRQSVSEIKKLHDGTEFDERDDSYKIGEYAQKVRDQERGAQVTMSAQLPQINLAYRRADILTGVTGRQISFNRLARGTKDEFWDDDDVDQFPMQFLQIVGIDYTLDGDRQMTTLYSEKFDS